MAQRHTPWAPSPNYGPPRPSADGFYSYEQEPMRLPHPMNMMSAPSSSHPSPVAREPQAQYYRPEYHQHHEYHQPPSPGYQQPQSPMYHSQPSYQYHQPPLPPLPSQLIDPYRSAPMPRYPQEPPRESPTTSSAPGESYDEFQAAREAHFLKRNQPPQMPNVGAPRGLNDNYQESKVAIPFTPPSLRIPSVRSGSSIPTAGASDSAVSQTERVKIEDLLSGGGIQAKPRPKNEYEIFFRQQPMAARCCGYGERDRRVIDPPPIVQLKINNPDLSEAELYDKIHYPAYVVHCSIWDETGMIDSTNMPDEVNRPGKRIMGSLVSSPFVGEDEKGEEGCFFCFPDMSVRTPGNYRLKFSLVVVHLEHKAPTAPIKCTITSDVFTVYNAKDFPGMQASTPLTKRLKEQGCLISIKKGNDKSGGKSSRRQDESDDERDEAGPSTKRRKPRKQQR
ncbi:hypothetical protein CCHL11_09643 [Colletotrichum chlorophyti]|uniref:Velvet domain-containing protein n=1 Tax=Colletotrichum chlorophyti TaxID=708187 RepID=A0A1Q8RFZ7_9PEZI|nr:hypothetical protein CCHL11_09643 [Colletotrichum chlorophyti]